MRRTSSKLVTLVALVTLVTLVSSCKRRAPSDSEAKDMFANSRRRVATTAELAFMGAMPSGNMKGCAAFFVENSGGKNFLGFARHCVDFKVTDWCNGGGKIQDRASGVEQTCKRVVAADSNHDIVLVELSGSHPGAKVRLAAYKPSAGTRLKMIGYPADQFANNGDIVSENCWLLVPHQEGQNAGNSPGNNDAQGRHNCSTYGGNSGGPILVEGTSEVIGLPSTYSPNDFVQRDPNTENLSYLDSMWDFVATFKTKLVQEGVTLVETQSTKGVPGDYFAVGRYKSAAIPTCDMYLKPLYNSGRTLQSIQVEYMGSGCSGNRLLTCTDSYCVNQAEGLAFTLVSGNSYYYTNLETNSTALYVLK